MVWIGGIAMDSSVAGAVAQYYDSMPRTSGRADRHRTEFYVTLRTLGEDFCHHPPRPGLRRRYRLLVQGAVVCGVTTSPCSISYWATWRWRGKRPPRRAGLAGFEQGTRHRPFTVSPITASTLCC